MPDSVTPEASAVLAGVQRSYDELDHIALEGEERYAVTAYGSSHTITRAFKGSFRRPGLFRVEIGDMVVQNGAKTTVAPRSDLIGCSKSTAYVSDSQTKTFRLAAAPKDGLDKDDPRTVELPPEVRGVLVREPFIGMAWVQNSTYVLARESSKVTRAKDTVIGDTPCEVVRFEGRMAAQGVTLLAFDSKTHLLRRAVFELSSGPTGSTTRTLDYTKIDDRTPAAKIGKSNRDSRPFPNRTGIVIERRHRKRCRPQVMTLFPSLWRGRSAEKIILRGQPLSWIRNYDRCGAKP